MLRAILILSCAVTGLSGFVSGYWLGSHSRPADEEKATLPETAPDVPKQSPDPKPKSGAAPIVPPVPEHSTEPAVPPVTQPPPEPPATDPIPPDPEPEPLKVIPAPEAALKAFLSAPDWQDRAKHVLHADRLLEKMESYHKDVPDGPTPVLSMKSMAPEDPEENARLMTYRVATAEAPSGFPVAIVRTEGGWKIDWETFVEFRDDHFRRFAAGDGSGTVGSFHLFVRNTHYFGEAFPGSDKLTAFRVDPPLPDREQYAFVATGSNVHKTLAAATEWGHPCAPVLRLVRKERPDGKAHLEITDILAPNWLPRE